MKKIIINLIASLMVLSLMPSVLAANNVMLEINVSADGSGNVQTLEQARELVRKNNKNMTGDIVVNVTPGTYIQDDTFVLTERDSGTNGYKVIWKGNNAVISGGRKISGFTQHSGDIYKAVLPKEFGNRKITGLYIDGEKQTRAGGRILYKSEQRATDMDNHAGWLIKDGSLDSILHPEEMQLRYGWSWIVNTAQVKGIGKDFEGNKVLIADDSASGLPTPVMYTFFLFNDYSFMTEPGDFYYESATRTMYYKKPANMDLNSAEIIVPYLDTVMKIQGTNNLSKVSNIEISGFTFSHCEDTAATKGSMKNTQSMVWTYSAQVPNYPSPTVQTASVWVNNAENILINDNIFSNSERVGLGLYEGVTDSKIDGNIFKNLASSGLTVGLTSHSHMREPQYELTNVAYNKETIASNNNAKGDSWKIVDDTSKDTFFHAHRGNNTHTFVQIDLGKKYNLEKIELEVFSTYGLPLGEFEIWGSNQENFLEYKQILKSTKEENPYNAERIWTADLSGNAFRYVRLVSTDKEQFILHNIRIYSPDEESYATSLCERNVISNNIFTKVSEFYLTAAGMTVFYVADTDIFHNELYGTPYTGISIGWGWAEAGYGSMNNNRINYNFINGAMQRGYDGGSIYSLGTQKNEEIRGNYILNQRACHGAIYPDNGAADILITENVAENVPKAYFPYSVDQDNLRVENNYATTNFSTLGAPNSYIKNTKLFVKGYMPEEAQKIADFAGLEKGYEGLREKAGVDRNTTEYEENYPNEIEMQAHAYGMNTGGGKVMGEYIREAQTVLDLAVTSGLITEEYSEITNEFKDAIKNATVFTENEELRAQSLNENDYFAKQTFIVTAKFRDTMQRFIDSGIFTNDNYDMLVQNMGLEEGGSITQPENAAAAELFTENEFSADEIFRNQEYLRDYPSSVGGSDTQLEFSGLGVGYTKYAFDDTTIKARIQIEPHGSYPGLVLRSQNGKNCLSTDDCYIIIFKSDVIELQRFNQGSQNYIDGNIPIGAFKFGQPNDIELKAVNENGGVRISCIINGQEAFNILDTHENAVTQPGFFGFLAPVTVKLGLQNPETAFYSDLSGYAWAADAVNALYIRQIATGKEAGKFAPADGLTRAEFSKMLVSAIGMVYNNQKTDFADVDENSWYYKPVVILEKLGAFDEICAGSFNADAKVSRKEAAMIIAQIFRAHGTFLKDLEKKEDFTDISHLRDSEKEAIALCAAIEILEGDSGSFMPDKILTRAETAVIIKRILETEYLV